MGSGGDGTSTKVSKPVPPATETSSKPTTSAYPDWSTSMQAFYGAGVTPPFFASTVASPAPNFLWGGQHPLMSPYGTPVYPAMYPPGGVYVHPNMVTNPGNVNRNTESDGKIGEAKDPASSKKNKGISGNLSVKSGDGGKATSGSGNDIGTQSAESRRSEGSSDDASDDNNQDFSNTKKGSFDQMLADGANAQNNTVPSNLKSSVAGASVPATSNLNIGMDLWNVSHAGSGGPHQVAAPSAVMSDQCVHDERELKRQKRKLSNRESARRSRLRKQAECEELQQKVEMLSSENYTLRDELQKLSEECDKLASENNNIKDELTRLYGPDVVSNLENSNSAATHVESHGEEEGNC